MAVPRNHLGCCWYLAYRRVLQSCHLYHRFCHPGDGIGALTFHIFDVRSGCGVLVFRTVDVRSGCGVLVFRTFDVRSGCGVLIAGCFCLFALSWQWRRNVVQ